MPFERKPRFSGQIWPTFFLCLNFTLTFIILLLFSWLQLEIDQLIYCLGEEMGVCTENIKAEMKPKYAEINQSAKELKYLFTQYQYHNGNHFKIWF